MFTLRPGIDEEEGREEIKQVFCVRFEVALGAQLRVPRKQRLGGWGGKDPAGTTTHCALACGVSLFRRGTGQCVSTLLHRSLFKDRRGFSGRALPSPSTLGRPLLSVRCTRRSQSRSLPALLVIPAAASFAHELPTAPGWVSDNVRINYLRAPPGGDETRLITGGAEGEVQGSCAGRGRSPRAPCRLFPSRSVLITPAALAGDGLTLGFKEPRKNHLGQAGVTG